ncbi:MAG: hypothetical protein R2824_04580 [Saprospiraceae bacterium]|nr:hypothetical protein [Lewinella sp.]
MTTKFVQQDSLEEDLYRIDLRILTLYHRGALSDQKMRQVKAILDSDEFLKNALKGIRLDEQLGYKESLEDYVASKADVNELFSKVEQRRSKLSPSLKVKKRSVMFLLSALQSVLSSFFTGLWSDLKKVDAK